uniref:Exportin-T n=1 Tax=Sander lucioperca TaxID=283035 RepID=A0A8C9XXP0_SANLU
MDEQALLGLNPNADARYRHRAMAYFEQLKESQDAWEVCAEALATGIYNDDHVKFFCFQVLEHQIKFRHAGLSAGQQQLIRETLMKCSLGPHIITYPSPYPTSSHTLHHT